MNKSRRTTSVLWNYYDRDVQQKAATCRYCSNSYSYSSTTANLKSHLKRRHPEVFARIPWNRKSDNEDDEADELLKLTGVWGYFEAEGEQARCELCGGTVPDDYDALKAHLREQHPKTLLDIIQKKEQQSDADSNDGNPDKDNTYTEVVYLEQETLTDNYIQKRKEKPKLTPKPVKRRESRLSSDEVPLKRKRNYETNDENNELDVFVKYISCLLKKLPPDVFSEVQVEIINTIMKANLRANQLLVLNKDSGSTSANIVTVNEITPVNNGLVGHNYTITVAPKEVTETSETIP